MRPGKIPHDNGGRDLIWLQCNRSPGQQGATGTQGAAGNDSSRSFRGSAALISDTGLSSCDRITVSCVALGYGSPRKLARSLFNSVILSGLG